MKTQTACIFKRFAAVLAVICAILSVPLHARADVISGWQMNRFYHEHKEDIIRFNVSCHTKERVSGYNEPGDALPGGEIEKGKTIYIEALWQDKNGDWWGVTEIDWDKGLWLPLSDLYLHYRSAMFEEDYADRIYTGERVVFENGKHIYLYNYPCAASYARDLLYTESEIPENEDYQPDTFFRDEEDRIWGLIRGDYGNSWVCVDDPYTELEGDDRYKRDVSALYLVDEATKTGRGRGGNGNGFTDQPAGAVITVVCVLVAVWIGAVVIVRRITKKKR